MTLTFTDNQRELLDRAIAWEDEHPGKAWTWRDVDAESCCDVLGEDLVKIVGLGFADIVGEEDPVGPLLYRVTPAGKGHRK